MTNNSKITENKNEKLNELYARAKELGVSVEQKKVGNMSVEHILVPDLAIEAILKTIHLNKEVQEEVIDKMFDRTPNYLALTELEQVEKIKLSLTMETVIEFLRLAEYIRSDIEMVEVGVNEESAIVVTAYYVEKNKLTDKVLQGEMSQEEAEEMEKTLNLFEADFDIFEEAKKKMDEKGIVVPFPNREQRRSRKKNKGGK